MTILKSDLHKEKEQLLDKFTNLSIERKIMENWNNTIVTRIVDINIEIDKIIDRCEEINKIIN